MNPRKIPLLGFLIGSHIGASIPRTRASALRGSPALRDHQRPLRVEEQPERHPSGKPESAEPPKPANAAEERQVAGAKMSAESRDSSPGAQQFRADPRREESRSLPRPDAPGVSRSSEDRESVDAVRERPLHEAAAAAAGESREGRRPQQHGT